MLSKTFLLSLSTTDGRRIADWSTWPFLYLSFSDDSKAREQRTKQWWQRRPRQTLHSLQLLVAAFVPLASCLWWNDVDNSCWKYSDVKQRSENTAYINSQHVVHPWQIYWFSNNLVTPQSETKVEVSNWIMFKLVSLQWIGSREAVRAQDEIYCQAREVHWWQSHCNSVGGSWGRLSYENSGGVHTWPTNKTQEPQQGVNDPATCN